MLIPNKKILIQMLLSSKKILIHMLILNKKFLIHLFIPNKKILIQKFLSSKKVLIHMLIPNKKIVIQIFVSNKKILLHMLIQKYSHTSILLIAKGLKIIYKFRSLAHRSDNNSVIKIKRHNLLLNILIWKFSQSMPYSKIIKTNNFIVYVK